MTSKQIRALELTSEDLSIPNIVLPLLAFSQGQDKDAYTRLFRVLDHLVLNQLRKTLKLQPHCENVSSRIPRGLQRKKLTSSQVGRSRYLKRMTQLTQDPGMPKSLEESEIHAQQLQWPAHFQITRRLGEVYGDILLASRVYSFKFSVGTVNLRYTFRELPMYYLPTI